MRDRQPHMRLPNKGENMNYKDEISKRLKNLSGKQNISTIFFDWVHLMAYTVSNSVDKTQFDSREAEYVEIIGKYTKTESDVFVECFCLLVQAFDRKVTDWLGEIYMDLEISNKDSGQFFTPYGISRLMSELTLTENEPLIEEKGWLGYYEPACGAGSMIIAFTQAMERKGYNYQQQLRVWCEDIDENCLLMTYVQLSLLGVNAVCEVKDSLSREKFSTWYTPFHMINPKYLFPEKNSDQEEKINPLLQIENKLEEEWTPPTDAEQLVLF